MTLKYFEDHFSLGCHFHVHFSNSWHAIASHGLPAIAELLVVVGSEKNYYKNTSPDQIQHGYPNLDNHRQSFGSWSIAWFNASCPGLAEPNSRSACNSAGQWLKFCDNIVICCNAPHWIIHRIQIWTVWWPFFQFNEVGHRGVQVSDSVAWTVCRCPVL